MRANYGPTLPTPSQRVGEPQKAPAGLRMGDFGPSYQQHSRPAALQLYRCDECSVTLPSAGGSLGHCPSCGGVLRDASTARAAGTGPDAGELSGAFFLNQMLAPGLLDLVSASADGPARPTDQNVLDDMPREKVEPYAQLVVVGPDGAEEPLLQLRGTGSTFGTPLDPTGVRGQLALADPVDGASALVGDVKGCIVLMWRGGCSFIEKVRNAQKAGAAACIVVQTAPAWPFTMADSKLQGADIDLPSLMVRSEDGEAVREALRAAAASGAELSAHAAARHSTCAICQDEMIATSVAVRLPCDHTFHEECLTKWLGKQHTCPTCRGKLPERNAPTPASGSEVGPREEFPEFGGARGAAGPASTSMYT